MISKNQVWLVFVITIIVLGCKHNLKKETDKNILNPGEDLIQNAIITGYSDDSRVFVDFNLLGYSYFSGRDYIELKRKVSYDSIHMTLNSFKEPQLMEISAQGDSSYYKFKIYVSPGDSISFNLRDGDWEFSGKNAAHYNFFNQSEMTSLNWPDYKGNIEKYKSQCQLVLKNKMDLLKQYQGTHKDVSENFISEVQAELQFEYLYNLIAPRDVESGVEGITYNNMKGVYATITNEFSTREKSFFDPKLYFDNIKIEDFNKPELINNQYFKQSLIFFMRYYFVHTDHLEYSRKNFLDEKKFIQNELRGELENYAIARLISDYYKNGFGSNTGNIGLLKNLISEYNTKFIRPSYFKEMERIYKSLNNLSFQLPVEVWDEQLVNIKGDTLRLKQILDKNHNKIKVIDFWASWCIPCIKEIKTAGSFKDRLSNTGNVSWIYISTDATYEKWINMSNKLQNDFSSKDQYRLLNVDNSKVVDYLGITSIPRYIILDKNEEIILDNAPKPSDSLAFEKIINDINLTY
ncbi:TlpA family protein disulfide reductase [Arenibacter latericius]|uniref:TlpA family protein disulfide reductase n=1 Tax=Arenibacter latericius TaxID=86104 RepID=UPI00041F4628|nr:thioredoxin family protein [Arenibacter latericius]